MIVSLALKYDRQHVDEENFQHYDPLKAVRWNEVFAGRLAWSLLTSFIFHRFCRSHYEMFFPLVQQRRLSRMRQSLWDVFRVSTRLVARLIAAAFIIFVAMQFIVWPTVSIISGFGSRSEASNAASNQASNNAAFSASNVGAASSQAASSTANAPSSSDYFMRSRQRHVEATYVLRIIGTSISRFFLHALSSMHLQWSSHYSVIGEVVLRCFQAGVMSFWIEFSFILTRLLLSEHLSFGSRQSRTSSTSSGASVTAASANAQASMLAKAKNRTSNMSSKKVGVSRSVTGPSSSHHRHPDSLLKNTSHKLDLSELDPTAWLEALFSGLESKSSPLVATHALLDLYHITHFLPNKRSLFYDPHLHDASSKLAFDKFASFASQLLDTFSTHLYSASDALESGASTKKSAGKSKGTEFRFSFDSPLSLVSSCLQWATMKKAALDTKIRQVFGWARPPQEKSGDFVSALRSDARSPTVSKSALGHLIERVVEKSGLSALKVEKWILNQKLSVSSVAPPTGATALYHKEQQLSMLLASISRIIEHSVAGEDEAGVVANSPSLLPLLLSLLRLHASLSEYASYVAVPTKVPSPNDGGLLNDAANVKINFLNRNEAAAPAREAFVPRRWIFSLQKSLDNALYSFATSYYEHLSFFHFSQNHIDILQKYVDFVA